MSLFKSKCSKSKLPNTKKIAEHSKVFCFKFTDICRQDRHAVTVSSCTVSYDSNGSYCCNGPSETIAVIALMTLMAVIAVMAQVKKLL